jgi:hypothetical protein
MTDQWLFKSETYDNCNCQINCGCQFNVPSTKGYCQSAYIGHIVEGHFNNTPLVGLNWAALYKWPGEIKDGNGKKPDSLCYGKITPLRGRARAACRAHPVAVVPRVGGRGADAGGWGVVLSKEGARTLLQAHTWSRVLTSTCPEECN